MIQENEIIVLVLAACVQILYLLPFIRIRIRTIAHYRLLMSSFYTLLAAWCLTILEGFLLPDLL